MARSRARRGARIAAAVLAVLLVVVACAAPPKEHAGVRGLTVGADGFRVDVGGVTVSGGPGVAPEGTAVSVTAVDGVEGVALPSFVEQVGDGVQVVLGDGLQPEAAVELRFKVDLADLPASERAVAVMVVSEDGATSLLEARVDTDRSELVATTDHLSFFTAFWLNVTGFVEDVLAGAGAVLDVTYPDPGCETRVEVPDVVQYDVYPPGQAYMCLALTDRGEVELEVHSAVNVPYTVSTDPAVDAVSLPGDIDGLLATAIGRTFGGDGAVVGVLAGGSTVRYTFPLGVSPESVTLTLRRDLMAVELILGALSKIDKGAAELMGASDCLWGMVDAWAGSADAPTESEATSGVAAAFGCAAEAGEGLAKILFGLALHAVHQTMSAVLADLEFFGGREVITTSIETTDLTPVVARPAPSAPGGEPPGGVLGSFVATVAGGGAEIYCQSALGTMYSSDGSEQETEIFSCVIPDQSGDEYPGCGGPATFSYFDGTSEVYCGDDFDRSGAVVMGDEPVSIGSFECTPGPGYAVVHCGRDDFAVQVGESGYQSLS